MNILVIGSGGREHAIVHAISKSSKVEKIYAAPGNAGISRLATCVNIKDTAVDELVLFAQNNKIDFTIVGPESSLAVGIVDAFQRENLLIFGPSRAAARIESSKAFAKELMLKYNIPTARYKSFSKYEDALTYVSVCPFPTVLKYDGLAAGKGVVIVENLEQAKDALKDMLLEDVYGHGTVVIEQFLEGPEFSFMCLVDEEKVYPLEMAQDHKRAFDDDQGPNTGGMGAYSPLPFITEEDKQYALESIMKPMALGLKKEGIPFSGILYGGLMKTSKGIKVIEFNARFGDPETEVVLPRLTSDFLEALLAIVRHEVPVLNWSSESVIGIVLASKGYPNKYQKGFVIKGADQENIYHMGTKFNEKNEYVTNGGRVLFAIAKGQTLKDANLTANKLVDSIECDALFHRTDIGAQAFEK